MDRAGNEKLNVMGLQIPVAANTTITEACMVAINSDGYAVEASKTEGIKIIRWRSVRQRQKIIRNYMRRSAVCQRMRGFLSHCITWRGTVCGR